MKRNATDGDDDKCPTGVETIGGYEVHPAASIFPLMQGPEFVSLCNSIEKHGVFQPLVFHGEKLLDGRNRLRALLELRERGLTVDLRSTQWTPRKDGELPAEFIDAINRERRHLTPDAAALASATILPLVAAERAERKKATQFEPGNTAAKTVDTKTCPPFAPEEKRDFQKKHANSTVGKIAADAGVSHHKARQAVAVTKAVAAGAIPQADVAAVMAGQKKLRDVTPKPEPVDAPTAENEDSEPAPTVEALMADNNRLLEAFAREITAMVDRAPGGLDPGRREILRGQLRSCAGTVRAAKGHAICPKCAGEGCKKCSHNGWLNKVEFESCKEVR